MNRKLAISTIFLTMLFFAGFAASAEIVNLNKANAAAVQQNLIGIGPVKAEAIISYRKKNGKFNSLDDLQNVKGIGPALIKKNKRYLSLSKGAITGDDKAYAATKKQANKSKTASVKKKSKAAANTSRKDTSAKAKAKTKTNAKSKKKSGTTKDDKSLSKTAKSKKDNKTSDSTKKKSSKKKSPKKKKSSKSST